MPEPVVNVPVAGGGGETERRLAVLAEVPQLRDAATPFLAVDLDAVDRNIGRLHGFFAGRPGRVRPHVKSHKCTAIARMQIDAGAHGVTCATTDEVTAMVAAGIDDVLVSSVVTDRVRLRALAAAAGVARVTATVDSAAALALLSEAADAAGVTVGIVIECDIGMRRNGVGDVAEGLALAEAVARARGVTLRGVMAYEGHLIDNPDAEERARVCVDAFGWPRQLLQELRRRGHEAPVLTGSSSATYDSTGVLPEMTDVQAGTYALMDPNYQALRPEFEQALAVIGTVLTSRPDGRLIVDFGAKRVGTDWGHARVAGLEAECLYIAEEHAVFHVPGGSPLRVGERVAVLPPHACTTMNLHRVAYGCRGGELDRPLAIDARDTYA